MGADTVCDYRGLPSIIDHAPGSSQTVLEEHIAQPLSKPSAVAWPLRNQNRRLHAYSELLSTWTID
jgi:hypothetical protein